MIIFDYFSFYFCVGKAKIFDFYCSKEAMRTALEKPAHFPKSGSQM